MSPVAEHISTNKWDQNTTKEKQRGNHQHFQWLLSSFQGMRMDEPVPTFSHLVRQLRSLRLGHIHVIESRLNNNVDCEPSGPQ